MRTGAGVAMLVLFALAIGGLTKVMHWTIAPAVLGLLVLLAFVVLARRAAPRLMKHDGAFERGARLLLRWMPLFFVPPAVGIVQSANLLRTAWISMLVVLAVSTLGSIAVTITVLRLLAKRAHA